MQRSAGKIMEIRGYQKVQMSFRETFTELFRKFSK